MRINRIVFLNYLVKLMARHQGKFRPKQPKKYKGNSSDIVYRSSWELATFIWCDNHPDIVEWSSEEVVVKYRCLTDNQIHRYFVDLKMTLKNGETYLIEIKPKSQIMPPKRGKKTQKTYLNEVLQYGKNISKWKQAKIYAEENGYQFQIWSEDILKKLGIKIIESFKS